MTKIMYFFLYACIEVVLFFILLISRKKTNVSQKKLFLVTLNIFLLIFSYSAALSVSNFFLAKIFYCLYFIFNVWVSYSVLNFSCSYVYINPIPKMFNKIMFFIAAFDTCIILFNLFFPISFNIIPSRFATSEIWGFRFTPLFYPHLSICYLMLLTAIFNIVFNYFASPRLFRVMYSGILFAIAFCVFTNGIFLFSNLKIDLAVLTYGFWAILLYVDAECLVPKVISSQMKDVALESMDVAVILLDQNKNTFFVNKRFHSLFEDLQAYGNLDKICNQFQLHDYNFKENFSCQIRSIIDNKKYYFKLNYVILKDHNSNCYGSSIILFDITNEMRKKEMEEYSQTHDSLTGLYNRRQFNIAAREKLNSYPSLDYYIITTNIKNFKIANDIIGRTLCDNLLINMANNFKQITRPEVAYGRLGSDNFALCMPKIYYKEEYFVQPAEVIKTKNFALISYIGVYEVVDRSIPIDIMCERATLAISTISDNVQKRVAYYDTAFRNKLLLENKLTMDFEKSLENKDFELYFQPQVNYIDNSISGVEALVRWNHPEQGLLKPDSFIPLFEKNGLITNLDIYVWDMACQTIVDLRKDNIFIPVSVNISNKDFFMCDLYSVITELVKKYDIPPKSLKLEITESAIRYDTQKQLELLKKLQDDGFIIEMDDFGSGYSSLNTLKDIPVNTLKMDLHFLDTSENSDRSNTILKMIVSLAKSLGTPIIAEGVEKKEQVDFLSKLGCNCFQGYYFSKPIPFTKFKETILEYNSTKKI